jgi:O-antigen/teichoic acid export membrane protein
VATLLTAFILVPDLSAAGNVAWVPVPGAVLTAVGTSWLVLRMSPFRRPADWMAGTAVRTYVRPGLHSLKADISSFIFTSSDRLFLYVFASPAAVGLYAAAYSVIQPFYLINAVVWDAMYLPVAQAFVANRLAPTFRRYVDLMCFATIPLGFFLLAFAPFVMSTLYGPSYAPASAYLAILGWVITFGYTSGIAVVPFSAWNRQREYGNATSVGGALNMGLNFLLIPPFGGFGAAWATVAAKIAVTLAGVRYFRRITDYPLVQDFAEYLAISAAAYAASIVAIWVIPHPVAGIVVFGLTYVTLVGAVRWRHSGPLSRDALRSLAPFTSGVRERDAS